MFRWHPSFSFRHCSAPSSLTLSFHARVPRERLSGHHGFYATASMRMDRMPQEYLQDGHPELTSGEQLHRSEVGRPSACLHNNVPVAPFVLIWTAQRLTLFSPFSSSEQVLSATVRSSRILCRRLNGGTECRRNLRGIPERMRRNAQSQFRAFREEEEDGEAGGGIPTDATDRIIRPQSFCPIS